MSMASRRPASSSSSSRGDIDVEDELQQLLKEQEEFMRQRARPAAKITRVGGAPPPVEEQPAQSEEPAPDDGVQVVGAVKERNVITLDGDTRMRVTSGGFPAVTRIRGESVFGRRQRQQRPLPSAGETTATLSGKGKIVERPPDVLSGQTKALASTATRADAVSERERQEIDAANAATLRNMSTADIRAAQQELASMLDPALLAKLKSRRPQPPTPATGKKREDVVAATRQLEAAGVDLSTIETEEQLFAAVAKLPIDERAKHAWMQPVPNTEKTDTKSKKTSRLPVRANQPKRVDTKKQPSGERFDFDGHVVVGDHQPPSHSGLYHHGDDPDAAGYTMDELLHLARSTVASQRAVALLTISKILHQRPQTSAPNVLPAELPVALRMALDDQNYTALSAALAAMHAYLCPRREEHASRSFESARGTVVAMPAIHIHVDVGTTKDELLHEVIYLDTTESEEDGSKIGDQELASLDPVQGLLKMAIVSRLRFIVTAIQLPDDDAMDKLLEILLQIAAHSPRAAQAIASDRNLLKALQTKYLENELVLTLQTEPAEAFTLAAARTLKVLRLVRVLCQGSRAVATALVEGGVIQSTKGFLAIRSDDETGGATIKDSLEKIHLETLRVWRVLLQYGLDFHCVAYLYPLLCGFDGVGLVRDKATDTAASAGGTRRWSDRCLAAIFAALEAFARLETIHEAQHYFHHLGFFTRLAQEEIGRRFKHLGEKIEDAVFVSVALRFLTACCGLVDKFHFDKTPFTETLKTLLQSAIPASTVVEIDVLVAITTFGSHAIDADLVGDDQDEEDVRRRLFLQWKPFISKRIASSDSTEPPATCELLLLTTESCLRTNHHDNAFLCSLYSAALQLVQELQPGHQFWVHKLFTDVLFHPVVLQQTGFFPDLQDATAMSRVLIPMYQALVNSTRGQEAHSQLLFGMPTNPNQTQTLHLVDPQDEHDYVGSNLPLPFDWLFCPFSRVEYLSQSTADASKKQKHAATVLGPSHAEADEMKVIVSAACRYIDQLESLGVATSSGAARLGDENKLFHLMHVFFAGTDVLFDDYVDLALSKLLAKYAVSVLHHPSPTALYDGLLRNLRQIESLEAGENRNETPTSFTTETQTVLTFVEKLVNEFTSSSFGNTHFAKLVTLFLLHDFPLEIRKWVWKELAASRLVHRLEPFNTGGAGGVDVRSAMGLRATRDAKHSDVTLVRAMTDAIATRHQGGGVVSHERGPFAYWLAIHHTAAYLFGDDANRAELSSARQQLLQDLVVDASPVVWRHLLSHETSRFSPTANADTKQVRVDRVLQHAAFTDAQVQAFRTVLDLAEKWLL
jgi:RNA polymerase II-associated protein 1